MITYLLKRLLWMLPVFFGVALISFAIVALFPGDYYTTAELGFLLSGMSRDEATGAVNALRYAAGIDKPWIVQFWVWFTGVITQGDLGVSWRFLVQPENGLGWTLIITGSAMLWAWVLGIPIGIVAAVRKDTWLDHALTGATYLGFAFPAYVWGALFFYFVYTFINPLFTGGGLWGLVGYELAGKPLTWYKAGSHILHLLPVWAIVGAPMFATVVRHTRMNVASTLSEPFITVARGKGISERRLLFRHALRNAINPLISIFGITLPSLITATILIGPVFQIPTFGLRVLLRAAQSQNQQMLTAALLFYASFLLIGNLIADILLVALDPRIRYD
ncbi:ABC transporter permease, partial [Candidatus Bipolaricaulota bacterium]